MKYSDTESLTVSGVDRVVVRPYKEVCLIFSDGMVRFLDWRKPTLTPKKGYFLDVDLDEDGIYDIVEKKIDV